MAEAAVPSRRRQPASQRLLPSARAWLGRAGGSDGHERHTLALIGKSTLAALLSWTISHDVIVAQSPAFAPFSAVLIMQVTVYQSVLQAARYTAAVCAGVAAQGLLGLMAGTGLLTFALVALAAMSIGRWRALGSQGSQVSTAAFFAFSTYVSATSDTQRWSQLAQIVELVLIGCAVGVAVNVLVLPPMRYRSAEYGVHVLAGSLRDLVGDIYPALCEGDLEKERTEQWRRRAAQLGPIVSQAQSSVRTARESIYYNPRRMLRRHRHHMDFAGYQAVIDALERVSYQLASMTRSLDQADRDDAGTPQHREFLKSYGDLLAALAPVMDLLSRVDEDHLDSQPREMLSAVDRAGEQRARLTEGTEDSPLPLSDPSRPYGILLAEAVRLTDEIQHTCDVLSKEVDEARTWREGGGRRS
jgi:hypothetical protein